MRKDEKHFNELMVEDFDEFMGLAHISSVASTAIRDAVMALHRVAISPERLAGDHPTTSLRGLADTLRYTAEQLDMEGARRSLR